MTRFLPVTLFAGALWLACPVTAEERASSAKPEEKTAVAAEHADKNDEPRPWRMGAESRPGRERLRDAMREGGGPPMMRVLTEEQIDEAISILNDVNPQRARELEKIRKENPERAAEIIRENMLPILELGILKRRAPEIYKYRVEDYKLNRQTEDIAREYRAAVEKKDDAAAKAKHQELIAKLNEQFAVRQKMREEQVARLEKQIAEMKTKIEATAKAKDELIKERVEELTNKEGKPEW
jgi:hypothetical protein